MITQLNARNGSAMTLPNSIFRPLPRSSVSLVKRASRKVLERMGSLYKILQETFQGLRIVKAFTMEPYERRRFCNATKDMSGDVYEVE